MIVEHFIDMLAPHCLGWKETIQATYMMARDVIDRGIPGDFVECGVYAGAECAIMARAITDAAKGFRRVHLFDSFQGIPKPGDEDQEFIASGNPEGDACCPIDGVRGNMQKWGVNEDLLVYHPGWFEDTMPILATELCDRVFPDSKIALLRLDGDLYESTKTCMKYLYPLVSRGGWVIVDDYQLTGCRKAIHEVNIPAPMYFEKL